MDDKHAFKRYMKAAVLVELNSPLEIMEIPILSPEAGQVLVKMYASGICNTQLLEIDGKNASGPHNPNLLGHEGSGIVEEVGEGVTKVKKGDHVILSWIKGSGANSLPKPHEFKGKKINVGFVTTFNEYCIASENRVTPIPKEMPLCEAALIGCAVATGAGLIFNNAKVQAGQSVMVVGVGGVGINTIHAASLVNANPIIAVDVSDSKLELAKKLGATDTINSLKEDVKMRIKEIAGNEGLDYAFEAVGRKDTMELVYNSVKKLSGRAVLCGVPKPGMTIEIDPFPLYYGRQLTGTGGGETDPDKDFQKYCQLYLEGKLRLKQMISHIISLNDINKGIELMRKGECCRVVIDFTK